MAGIVSIEADRATDVLEWKISCPACGGAIVVHDGSRILHCSYCGERHLRNRANVLSLEVPFSVDVSAVESDIKRWLRSNGYRATSMGDPVRLLVPYWRSTDKRLHWTRTTDGVEPDATDVPDTKIERSVELRPAFNGADAFPTDDALPRDFGCALPFDPRQVADNVLVARPGDGAPVDVGEGADVQSPDGLVVRCELDRELALLYFPFVTVRYTFRDEHHTVIACGVTGTIFDRVAGDVRATISGDLAGGVADGAPAAMPAPDPLGCPECGRHLDASEQALHHACLCGRDWALDEGGVRQVESRHVRGDGEQLPFWRFDIRLDRNGRTIDRHVFVPAFEPCPPSLFRRLAVGLTSLEPDYRTERGAAIGEAAWPCRLPMSEARRTISVLTRELWENSELDAIEGVTLMWIPFESRFGYLVDPVTDVRMPDGSTGDEDLAG